MTEWAVVLLAVAVLALAVAASVALLTVPVLWWRYFVQQGEIRRLTRGLAKMDKVLEATLQAAGLPALEDKR